MRINPVPPSYITYHQVCDNSDTTGATCGTKTACHSSVLGFTPAIVRLSFRCVRVHPRLE